MQGAPRLEHLVIATAAVLVEEADVGAGRAHAQVAQGDVGKPRRQIRIHEQHLQRRVGVNAQQRLHEREDRGGGPGLGRAGLAVEGGERVVLVAGMSREHLGQAVEIEQARGLELRAAEPLEVPVQAVAQEADREAAVLDGPDGAAVVTVRVVGGVPRGQRAHPQLFPRRPDRTRPRRGQ